MEGMVGLICCSDSVIEVRVVVRGACVTAVSNVTRRDNVWPDCCSSIIACAISLLSVGAASVESSGIVCAADGCWIIAKVL